MTVTITENLKYRHLSADRSQIIKPGGVGVEKEIVCNIVLVDEDLSNSVIGEFVADFTQVGLKQAYACTILAQDTHEDSYFFKPHATSDAALARFHVTDLSDGLSNNDADLANTTVIVAVRGV